MMHKPAPVSQSNLEIVPRTRSRRGKERSLDHTRPFLATFSSACRGMEKAQKPRVQDLSAEMQRIPPRPIERVP